MIRITQLFIFLASFVTGFLLFDIPVCQGDEIKGTTVCPCTSSFENGSINWRTGDITAIGKAAPKDEKEAGLPSVPAAARADANRQIILLLKQIKINKVQTVDHYASGNDIILAGIEKTADDARILKQYYTSAMAVEIRIQTSMYGGFLQLVLPEEIRQIPKINPVSANKEAQTPAKDRYTGLILDARGLGFEPVLNPVIVSEQGNDIYSSVYISREFAVQNGVCKYACTKEEALKEERIGSRPLFFKGLRKEGKENSSIVVSMSDYHELEKTTERHEFLKECRVVIIID